MVETTVETVWHLLSRRFFEGMPFDLQPWEYEQIQQTAFQSIKRKNQNKEDIVNNALMELMEIYKDKQEKYKELLTSRGKYLPWHEKRQVKTLDDRRRQVLGYIRTQDAMEMEGRHIKALFLTLCKQNRIDLHRLKFNQHVEYPVDANGECLLSVCYDVDLDSKIDVDLGEHSASITFTYGTPTAEIRKMVQVAKRFKKHLHNKGIHTPKDETDMRRHIIRPAGIEGKKFTVKETSHLTGYTKNWIYRMIRNGSLPEHFITKPQGFEIRIDLDQWLKSIGV